MWTNLKKYFLDKKLFSLDSSDYQQKCMVSTRFWSTRGLSSTFWIPSPFLSKWFMGAPISSFCEFHVLVLGFSINEIARGSKKNHFQFLLIYCRSRQKIFYTVTYHFNANQHFHIPINRYRTVRRIS